MNGPKPQVSWANVCLGKSEMQTKFQHLKLSSPGIEIVLSIILMQYLSANSIRAHKKVLRCEYNWNNTPASRTPQHCKYFVCKNCMFYCCPIFYCQLNATLTVKNYIITGKIVFPTTQGRVGKMTHVDHVRTHYCIICSVLQTI